MRLEKRKKMARQYIISRWSEEFNDECYQWQWFWWLNKVLFLKFFSSSQIMMTNTFSRVYNRFFDAVTTPGVRSSVVIVILCAVTVILFSYGDPGVAQVAVGRSLMFFKSSQRLWLWPHFLILLNFRCWGSIGPSVVVSGSLSPPLDSQGSTRPQMFWILQPRAASRQYQAVRVQFCSAD